MAEKDDNELTLQSVGLTLVGVIVSIGVTVAFGLTGPWWFRTLVGIGTAIGLIVLVGYAGRRTSALARLADWITGK